MADRLDVNIAVRGGLHGLVDLSGYDIAAYQVADIVDDQIQPVRRQAADLFRQVGDHQGGDKPRFESQPEA